MMTLAKLIIDIIFSIL